MYDHEEMIERRMARGYDEASSRALLAELLAAHEGENLRHALRYNGFSRTRRERMEARAERRRDWAASREQKAAGAREAERAIGDRIPMGQPILVGHHSEGRARRDVARMRSLADKTVEHGRMAEHHASRAEGIERQLRGSIFSDDHDAIEQLDAKIAKLEAERDRIKAYNKTCKKGQPHGDLSILDERQRAQLVSYFRSWPGGVKDGRWPSLTNLGAKIRSAQKRRDQLAAKAAS